MKHVILGAGPAGVIAAETLRKHAPADAIMIVGDEPEAPYSRMAIPYLLMGNIDEIGHPPAPRRGPLSQRCASSCCAAARRGSTRGRARSRSTTAARSRSTAC